MLKNNDLRRIYGVSFALVLSLLAITARARIVARDDTNGNPAYCHGHSSFDPLWWYYECWLPDPPGMPMLAPHRG